jgi:hypothetical protein
MEKPQAIATLEQGLVALFPYADPKDDPDRRRAQDQRLMREALDVLSKGCDSTHNVQTLTVLGKGDFEALAAALDDGPRACEWFKP